MSQFSQNTAELIRVAAIALIADHPGQVTARSAAGIIAGCAVETTFDPTGYIIPVSTTVVEAAQVLWEMVSDDVIAERFTTGKLHPGFDAGAQSGQQPVLAHA